MENINYKDPNVLLKELETLYNEVLSEGEKDFKRWENKIERESFLESAKNLVHYLDLRTKNIKELQLNLIPLGLSSLGRLEAKTIETFEAVLHSLSIICGHESRYESPCLECFELGKERLDNNTEEIFGEKPEDYRTRIMVTMPTEASEDYKFIDKLVEKGMNVARVNCSHDDESVWSKIIDNIKKAAKSHGKDVRILMDLAGPKIRTDWVYSHYEDAKLVLGDKIRLLKNQKSIDPDSDAKVQIGITFNPAFDHLEVGDPVLFDDGTIDSVVESIDDDGALLAIKKIKKDSKRLKAQKGLNFPKTKLDVEILSKKDKNDLKFAIENADIIGCSFIRTADDIEEIQGELKKNLGDKANEVALMAKIETVSGVENLPNIILQGASKNPFCVMIARGDLAVESGYIRLAELQQEISWICEAADIPAIWATEVLANMVETGIPSRAEMTDAFEGAKSECVMLNKGNYLPEAIDTLKEIFIKNQEHQYKKTHMFRALGIAKLK